MTPFPGAAESTTSRSSPIAASPLPPSSTTSQNVSVIVGPPHVTYSRCWRFAPSRWTHPFFSVTFPSTTGVSILSTTRPYPPCVRFTFPMTSRSLPFPPATSKPFTSLPFVSLWSQTFPSTMLCSMPSSPAPDVSTMTPSSPFPNWLLLATLHEKNRPPSAKNPGRRRPTLRYSRTGTASCPLRGCRGLRRRKSGFP